MGSRVIPGEATSVMNATTVHCPACGTGVLALPDATAAVCARCKTAFSPWGLPTMPPPGSASAVTPPATGDSLVGTTLGVRRLLRVIGKGGMGTVYEAEDPARGRVAVKVLPPHLARDDGFVTRFRREAAVLAGLSHPNLVEVFERGQDGDRCYFVMEYVRGESLRKALERGPLPWRDALCITRDVLSGLGFAHGRGVVHRDLKPENVILEADGRARLLDFGLSRIVRGEAAEDLSRLTHTNVVLGTYEYMAPEQRLGSQLVDERSDLYALGVILYEMLTGSLPLGRFEPASVLRPGVPGSLDAVINRALAGTTQGRHPSAAAFREAIDAAEANPAAGPSGVGLPAAVPVGTVPSSTRLTAAHKVLRHVEVLAACDRVFGMLLILFGFGALGMTGTFFGNRSLAIWPWTGSASVLFVIGGLLLLKQGHRMSAMRPGAREGQVTASIFLMVALPPIGTALGIYGLAVMTTGAARDAFRLGVPDLRAALLQSGIADVESASAKPRKRTLRDNVQWFAVHVAISSLLALLFYRWQQTFHRPVGAYGGPYVAEDTGMLVWISLFTGAVMAMLHRLIGLPRAILLVSVGVAFYLFTNSTSLSDALRLHLFR